MRRHVLTLLVLLAVLVPLAGCGDDDDTGTEDASATTAPAESPIAGRTFEAVSLESDVYDLVEGVTLSIAFTDDQITVDAGCNRLSGTYAIEGPILVVTGLGGTEMGCEPELMEQDAWIAGVLTARPVFTPQAPDGLLLSDDDWTLTMAAAGDEAADDDVELAGPEWTLDTLIDGEAASSVPEGVTATITFADDGTYAVAAGCNTGRGTYVEDATTLTLEPPTLTRRRCDEAATSVETAVVAVLDGEADLRIDANRLTLTAASGAGLSLTTPA
ncbi:MAG TPA: META domain-containing protein [Iamia sp.]|jgi:heat shock protein HslJ|nr:META domain-containing protein [Iamia sp.]